jgi:hypothetical protein
MGYQYALYQHRKKLREERDMILQDKNSISRGSTGMTVVKIPSTAEKGTETQSTTGGQRHAVEKKGT